MRWMKITFIQTITQFQTISYLKKFLLYLRKINIIIIILLSLVLTDKKIDYAFKPSPMFYKFS